MLLVDDILTTGGSLLAMIPAVEEAGGEIVACHVLVDRSGGLAALTSPRTGRSYPLRALWALDLPTWEAGAATCPLCASDRPIERAGQHRCRGVSPFAGPRSAGVGSWLGAVCWRSRSWRRRLRDRVDARSDGGPVGHRRAHRFGRPRGQWLGAAAGFARCGDRRLAVESAGLDQVKGFTLRTNDGETIAFMLGPLENGDEFPPGHLKEHQAAGCAGPRVLPARGLGPTRRLSHRGRRLIVARTAPAAVPRRLPTGLGVLAVASGVQCT